MKTPLPFIIVDDDPFNNIVCKYTILKFDADAHVQLFTDPEKALAAIKEQFSETTERPNTILFLDINMPGINGWEFIEIYATFNEEIHQQITIYILSSSIDPGDQQKADTNPFVKGYYSKPLSIETINQLFKSNN